MVSVSGRFAKPNASKESGYLMIEQIHIKNFRCFRDLELGVLKRFNVLVGESGSGKTAFLEAIFMAAAANPEAYLRLRTWRGLGEIRLTGMRRSYESMFREIFFGFDKSEGASIRLRDSRTGQRSISINYRSGAQYSLPLRAGKSSAMVIDPLLFRWKVGDKVHDGSISIEDGKLNFVGFSDVYPIWLISPAAPENLAENFSELSKRQEHKQILEAIRGVFPWVCDLSLESIAGQLAICASLDGLSEKLPIGFVSGGIHKFLWILLAIASNPNGTVLIDEAENGLYFRSMQPMLESVVSFAELHNVQLFITTHSREFLDALAIAMEGRDEHFVLLRTQHKGAECQVHSSQGRSSLAALQQHLELR